MRPIEETRKPALGKAKVGRWTLIKLALGLVGHGARPFTEKKYSGFTSNNA